MPFRNLLAAALTSLTIHAIVGASFYSVWRDPQPQDSEQPVTISYLRDQTEKSSPAAVAVKAEQPKADLPALSKRVVDALKRKEQRAKVHGVIKPAAFHGPVTPPAADGRPIVSASNGPSEEVLRQSRELLKDPEDRKVYSNYFGAVKEKIHRVVRRKYSRRDIGEGSVSLIFVLRRDGSLENVWIQDKQSGASRIAREFAAGCVRQSAPFPPFPAPLGLNRISFNITVLFQEI